MWIFVWSPPRCCACSASSSSAASGLRHSSLNRLSHRHEQPIVPTTSGTTLALKSQRSATATAAQQRQHEDREQLRGRNLGAW